MCMRVIYKVCEFPPLFTHFAKERHVFLYRTKTMIVMLKRASSALSVDATQSTRTVAHLSMHPQENQQTKHRQRQNTEDKIEKSMILVKKVKNIFAPSFILLE